LTAPSGERDGASSAARVAVRNALQLGGSLVFTWSIAIVVRFLVPRYLGPSRFGVLSFADAFTTTCFIALSLGIDTYIRKEVAVRPSHASDFFGGAFVLRACMAVGVFGVMAAVLWETHRAGDVWVVVALYGVTQFFVTSNATLSALLHAKGRVRAMSVVAVLTKIVWALGVITALFTQAGLWAYAAAYLASEAIETAVLYRLARVELELVFRIDRGATRRMLVSSAPYYLTLFAITSYGKLDVALLEFLGNTREVGWYSAASSLASLALLITPLIGWVLMPMFARAAARSRSELYEQVRRSLELILTLAIPASLMLTLGAPLWVRLIFGPMFAPAASALRILASMFVLTYVAMLCAQTLTMLDRAWALTAISLGGLVVNVALNLLVVPRALAHFGPGGGGTGCALAMLGTEVFVTSCMMVLVGRSAFDRRSVAAVAKTLAASTLVVLIHRASTRLGDLRLVLDAMVYAFVVVSTGALKLRRMAAFVRESIRSREQSDDPEAKPALST
jgi:O-antigen/teichoic acid export membrane protein